MEVKYFQIMDRCTFIPAIGMKLHSNNPIEQFILKQAGFYSTNLIQVMILKVGTTAYCPDTWKELGHGRTMFEAHKYIQSNFHTLESGAVVDVQYILGESEKPQASLDADHIKILDHIMGA